MGKSGTRGAKDFEKSMKQINLNDILASVGRKNIESAAKASLVLQETYTFLEAKKMGDFWWKPSTWKNGILKIMVEHPAAAQIIYGYSEECKEHLQKKFPQYEIKEIRTEIGKEPKEKKIVYIGFPKK